MIDCFMFRDELDLLEIRLNYLAPYIERFVLVESEHTWTGIKKPLIFQENKERFKNFNITHLIYKYQGKEPWDEERANRDFLAQGFKDESPDKIIMVSDIDEIPNMEAYTPNTECVFKHKLYYYYVNTPNSQILRGSIALKKKNWGHLTTTRHRRYRLRIPVILGGWHFSTLGSEQDIITKIEACAHQEFNTPEIKSKVKERKETLVDLYGRTKGQFTIEDPSGPKYLLDNRERYGHLFYAR